MYFYPSFRFCIKVFHIEKFFLIKNGSHNGGIVMYLPKKTYASSWELKEIQFYRKEMELIFFIFKNFLSLM